MSVCRRGVLKPRSNIEGGDESVKDRARGQAQAIQRPEKTPSAVFSGLGAPECVYDSDIA